MITYPQEGNYEKKMTTMVSAIINLIFQMNDPEPPFTQVETWINGTYELTLSHIIHQEVTKKRPSLQYSNIYVISIISSDDTNSKVLIDKPISYIFQVTCSDKQNEVNIIIDIHSSYRIRVSDIMNVF